VKVVDAIARILKIEGADFLSAYPTTPLIEAAAKAEIRPVLCRQERVGVVVVVVIGVVGVVVGRHGDDGDGCRSVRGEGAEGPVVEAHADVDECGGAGEALGFGGGGLEAVRGCAGGYEADDLGRIADELARDVGQGVDGGDDDRTPGSGRRVTAATEGDAEDGGEGEGGDAHE
jgi:hypothetical protein